MPIHGNLKVSATFKIKHKQYEKGRSHRTIYCLAPLFLDTNILVTMKKWILAIALISIFLEGSTGSSVRAASQPIVTGPSQAVEVIDANDYATEAFADPWDMSNSKDISHKVVRFANASMSNGIWTARTISADSYFWFLWGGYPGSTPDERDGVTKPVNAGLYKRLTFKMYLNKAVGSSRGTFYWFYRQDLKNGEVVLFKVYEGWHIYQIDLPARWSGWPISLRLDPVNLSDTTVKIDWIRLTNKPGTSVNLSWNDTEGGQADVYIDNNNSGHDGTLLTTVNSKAGSSSASIDLDGLEPGSNYFYLKKSGGVESNYSDGSFTVNKAPIVKVIEPDAKGGTDWARRYLGNPWDMSSPRDIIRTFNIAGSRFRRGIYSGVNTRRKSDPYFMLNLGGKNINTSRFHRLTFRYRYSGNFSLGRGTVSRFGWTTRRLNSPRYWQITDDIVTYTGWNTLTVDLKKVRLNRGSFGWRNYVTRFRFDPHEDRRTRAFYVDYITLREDDRLRRFFDIKFNLIDTNDATNQVKIYRDKDRQFGNGNEAIIADYNTRTGLQSRRWAPSGSLRGLFWIFIQASDGKNTSGFYSSGPLRVH